MKRRAVARAAPARLRAAGCLAVACLASPCAASEAASPAIDIGAAYVSDSFANVRGGIDRGVRVLGKLDFTAQIDGSAFGVAGGEAFVDVQLIHGESLSGELVGDAQTVSNIEAPYGLRVLEAWVRLPFAGDKGFFKGGLIDLNGEFDVQNVGALFVNSSHGIGPDFSQSGLNGPSIYPITSTAVMLGWKEEAWSARVGLFDAVSGDPDRPRRTVVRFPGDTGLLLVAEADVRLGGSAEFQLGAWTYSSRFDGIDESRRLSGNRGAYALVEGTLAKLPGDKAVDGWVRAGVAETSINPIGLYAGGGVTYGDETSRIGLAVAHARLGDPARELAAVLPDRAETSIELTWSRKVGERLTVQPDLQYVINPGWDPELRDALVLGIRLDLSIF